MVPFFGVLFDLGRVVLAFVKIYVVYYSLSLLFMQFFVVVENSGPNFFVRPPLHVLLVYYSSPRYFIDSLCVLLSSLLRMGAFVIYFEIICALDTLCCSL